MLVWFGLFTVKIQNAVGFINNNDDDKMKTICKEEAGEPLLLSRLLKVFIKMKYLLKIMKRGKREWSVSLKRKEDELLFYQYTDFGMYRDPF